MRRTSSLLPVSLNESWSNLVAEYTRLNLTFPEDRLAAKSGPAGPIRPQNGSYIVGFWDCSAVTCGVEPSRGRKTRSILCADVVLGISLVSWGDPRTDVSPTFRVLHIRYELRSENPFSQTQKGPFVLVSGLAAKVKVIGSSPGSPRLGIFCDSFRK